MNNKLSKPELSELWDTAQHMLKNPIAEYFNPAKVERVAEQHWRYGEQSLDLLVKVQADWLRLAMTTLALNGSPATAMQQSTQNWRFWSAQFLQLQQLAWLQWRKVANGWDPFSLAGIAVTEEPWRQLAQNMRRIQQSLLSTLAPARGKPNDAKRDILSAETSSGRCTAA